jgi:hypothetical protein
MITQPDKYLLQPRLHVVSIDTFFKYDKIQKTSMADHNIAKNIDSWFEECIKGWDYLNQKYLRQPKEYPDKFPIVTKALKEAWQEYDFPNSRPQDENNFRKASERFVEFIKGYEGKQIGGGFFDHFSRPETVVKYLVEAIYFETRDQEIEVHTGWLISDTMFNKRLIKYMEDQGVIEESYR